MDFEATAKALLQDDDDLTAVVPAASIYFGETPPTVSAPFIVCSRTSTTPQNTLGQGITPPLDNILLQVSCYGQTAAQTGQIARLVRKALPDSSSISALLLNQIQSFEEDLKIRGQILIFSCWFTETFE